MTDEAPRRPSDAPTDAAGASARLPGTLLVQAARVIASQLRSTRMDDGLDIGWATAAPGDGSADLYGGKLGIALFLAAYARVDGCEWARDLALRTAAPTRRAAARAPDAGTTTGTTEDVALGGLVGRGAQIYGLTTLGRLLDEPALLDEAHALATSIETRWIRADRKFDVVHGSAGLILALLSLGAAVAEPGPSGRTPLDHVRTASMHLLANQQARDAPWAGAVLGPDGTLPQSGFAHGATGVSVALARAGRVLGDEALLAAAARALAFERTHCAVEPGRWRMAPGDARTPIGWCRGAPGAALGRCVVLAASHGHLDDAEATRNEIDEAQSFMQPLPRLALDHLCCGGMSIVDALLALSQAGGPDALLAAAHARASWILRAAKSRGRFALGTKDETEPALFQGLAGVGYGLLRLAEPEALPCVLMLA